MIKLLYFTDPHYSHVPPQSRTDSYGTDILRKLDEIVVVANKGEVNAAIFGGDLLHKKHNVSMAEVRELIEIFKRFEMPVIGILGNHDVTGYVAATKNNRAAGVLEAADVITWVDTCVSKIIKDCIVISGAPYSRDYERLESYGKNSAGKRSQKKDVLIWLSHGMLVQKGKPPYEHTKLKDVVDSTDADIVLNGHLHTDSWAHEANDKLIINPGSIGRVAKNDEHHPSIVLIGIDEGKHKWQHKIVPLKSVRKHDDVFLTQEAQSKSSDEDIREFAETLAKDSEDLQTEDLKAVVNKACEGKEDEVKTAVLGRLGV